MELVTHHPSRLIKKYVCCLTLKFEAHYAYVRVRESITYSHFHPIAHSNTKISYQHVDLRNSQKYGSIFEIS